MNVKIIYDNSSHNKLLVIGVVLTLCHGHRGVDDFVSMVGKYY